MGADSPEEPGRPRKRLPVPVRPVRGRGESVGRPRSVRDSVAELHPPSARETAEPHGTAHAGGADPEEGEVRLCAEGIEWTIRVRGRGRAGAKSGPAPLLVLGFFDDPTAEEPRREALVVARRLSDMSERQLEGAFRIARPPTEPGSRGFFPETTSRRKSDG